MVSRQRKEEIRAIRHGSLTPPPPPSEMDGAALGSLLKVVDFEKWSSFK